MNEILCSVHQKKVYTCNKAKYSKDRGMKKSMGCGTATFEIPRACDAGTKGWYVAIPLNLKMRLGPVWTNSMVGVLHPLFYIWPPQFLVLGLTIKNIYFFGANCK